jgi:hypothetical protein
VHNHPSGVANPSSEGKSLADRIQERAKLLSLEFTDFVIVGPRPTQPQKNTLTVYTLALGTRSPKAQTQCSSYP